MALMTVNRKSPFSPFSVVSVTEIHRPPFRRGCFRCRFPVEGTPPHLRASLLDYFQQTYPLHTASTKDTP